MQNRRSPISEYIPLSRYVFKESTGNQNGKRKMDGRSETLLIVNNWHFNRDVMKMSNPTACKPEDCSIQIKISSTNFQTKDTNAEFPSDFHFDKNGISIPYSAFVWLCDAGNEEMALLMTEMKNHYDSDVKKTSNVNDALSDDEPLSKKSKKSKK